MSNVSYSEHGQSKMIRIGNPCDQRRRVYFSTEADDICYLRDVAPASMMTDEERDSAWYTFEDMTQMKEKSRILAQRLRVVINNKTSSTPPLSDDDVTQSREKKLKRRLSEKYPLDFTSSSSAAIEENTNETPRGLELRIFVGRQIKRYDAAHKILEYQRKYKLMIAIAAKNRQPNIRLLTEDFPKKLGYISARYSRWARDMALVIGHSDFKGAYEQLENPMPASSFEEWNRFSFKRKRTNDPSSLVDEIEINSCSKKQIFNLH